MKDSTTWLQCDLGKLKAILKAEAKEEGYTLTSYVKQILEGKITRK